MSWWGDNKIDKIPCRVVVRDEKGKWKPVHTGTYNNCEKWAYSQKLDEYEIQRASTGENL